MGVSLSVLQIYNDFFRSPNPIKLLTIKYLMIWHDFCRHLAMSRENAVKARIKSNFYLEGHFGIRVYNIIFFKKKSPS